MKKILKTVLLLLIVQTVVYASGIQDKNTVDLSEKIKNMFISKSDEQSEFYAAYAINDGAYLENAKSFSELLRSDTDIYYVYFSKDGKEKNAVEIQGISKKDGKCVFDNIYGDNEDGKAAMEYDGTGAALKFVSETNLEDINAKKAFPLFIMTEDNYILKSAVWVTYNDNTEALISDISYDSGNAIYKAVMLDTYLEQNALKIPECVDFAAFSDCDDKSVTTLKRLGIIDGYDGKFNPGSTLTRAESAKLIARMMMYGDTEVLDGLPVFSDTANHWARTDIGILAQLNVVNGFPDGTFAPDSTVTKIQFAKLLLNLLGNEKRAAAFGGYPDGYARLAADEGICSGADDSGVTRLDAAKMIYNALSCSVYVVTGYDFGSDNAVSQTLKKSDKTALEYICRCDKVKGVLKVSADGKTGSIGSRDFYLGYTDAKSYAGREYTHYITSTPDGDIWLMAQ